MEEEHKWADHDSSEDGIEKLLKLKSAEENRHPNHPPVQVFNKAESQKEIKPEFSKFMDILMEPNQEIKDPNLELEDHLDEQIHHKTK